ncbi:hypothetical protein DEJ50_04775 [Streptomyces venezuelae]|uniref:Uncharacterized protein n=1 Tax=Streptomyces venezuelae TaxID=54571 RepID=A0A5P2CWG3_STRVZ|nr:hypothetical protein [Streptomyces venezuelae]QES47246.1 hypothetical protein DEJ50_04775 [Streptomyces venezuelae]
MSYGLVWPSIAEIAPTVGYSSPASAGYPGSLDVPAMDEIVQQAAGSVGSTVGSLADGAQQSASHAMDAAGHALQELLEPAAIALGALSGALLVGRAAMVTTQVLAAAAVRAAEEQACLERGQEAAAAVTAQWEAAAFAAVRANARRTVLLARGRRAAFRTPPDTPPPPLPVLPPPVTATGVPLGVLRKQLAALEAALGEAEAAHARWTVEQALHTADTPEEEDWRRRMLSRREAAVRARRAEPAAVAPAALPQPPAADRLGRQQAEESGAELLALLDTGADAKDAELAVAAVRHAVECAAERPAKARIHLREARRFVADANRAVRARLAAQEKAAVQLDFLLTEAPPGEPPLAPATEETALLRKALEEGRALGAEEQRAVDRRVEERLTDLECRYTRELMGLAVARLADTAADGRVRDGRVRDDRPVGAPPADPDGLRCFDLTPAGWWPGHWLRITVGNGKTELVTMYQEHSGPRSPADLALDARRCHEAHGHLEELREAGRRWGLELPVSFTESGSAVPGVRGADGAVVLDAAGADAEEPWHEAGHGSADPGSAGRPTEPRKARHVDDHRRSTGR